MRSAATATIVTALAAVAALATPAHAIVDGEFTESAPWSARLYQDGSDGYCTATVVGPQWILTARHCIGGEHRWGFRIGDVEHAKGEYVDAADNGVTLHRDADLALVRLAKPVAAPAVSLGGLDDVATGDTVTIHGWGDTGGGKQSPLLKNARLEVTDVAATDAYGGRAVNGNRINGVCGSGDSGGPMFNAAGVQVGVLSTGNATSCQYTHVGAYRDWIASVTG
ncbi:S1 family peptidase [Amycolatopsis suaedae]|uniref:Trypsin-like serine protease n=1 Tax=Amycolatopsis suaedae TaxID=2510978 RepID=A0A4Q7IZH4_9PSEU|nr:trypsin-like serine protease [Amycolatopsis suaedae]RZQ59682.1 trypsin-like serine protease [Amycolatopsis suaedae]